MPALTALGLTAQTANTQIAGGGLAKNFDTFLTLLTEQLKNQDPLSPLDSTQFVSQLVQFSGVEQQIAQNRNLESLLNQNAASAATSAVGFIGKQADILGAGATLNNGAATWSYASDPGAAAVTILVKDANGKIVYKADGQTGPGDHSFVWDGKDNAGTQLPDGRYDLEVSALDENGNIVPARVSTSVVITGADFSGPQPALLADGLRITFADILAVRDRAAGTV